MTNKKLKVNSAAYTELSIQIAVLQASVDKLLQLAMKPEQTITNELDTRFVGGLPGHGASYGGIMDYKV